MYGPSVSVTHVRGTSWMHRLDPVAKFAWLIPAGIFCFTTYLPLPLFGLLLFGLAVAISAKIIKPLLRVLVLFTPITASIIVIQGLSPVLCGASCEQEMYFGPLKIYGEGLSHALSLMLRVASFQILAFGLILSTHPSDMFASLARMKVPYLINFMISMTLQLVPVLQREVQLVLAAQRSRGMKGTGFGSIVPSFVPVAAGAVERVQQLAISLESRAFGSKGEKTSYRRVPSGPFDLFVGLLGIVVMIGLTIYGLQNWGQSASTPLVFAPVIAMLMFGFGLLVFFGVFVVAIRALISS
ncbi:MAG: energy-coupling factor transporter transmembrane protein EcfT [bacterium]|nr:energy-coupling factor transporter transmembrane protein EcfT [Candidatus Aquidulcis frankliniae]